MERDSDAAREPAPLGLFPGEGPVRPFSGTPVRIRCWHGNREEREVVSGARPPDEDSYLAERALRVVQLVVYARGRGVVELQFEQAGKVLGGMAVAYPQQGTMIGEPARDVQNAERLREAAAEFNRVLDELCA